MWPLEDRDSILEMILSNNESATSCAKAYLTQLSKWTTHSSVVNTCLNMHLVVQGM